MINLNMCPQFEKNKRCDHTKPKIGQLRNSGIYLRIQKDEERCTTSVKVKMKAIILKSMLFRLFF